MNKGPVNLYTGFGHSSMWCGAVPSSLHNYTSRAGSVAGTVGTASGNRMSDDTVLRGPSSAPAADDLKNLTPPTTLVSAAVNKKSLLYGAVFLLMIYVVLKN